MVIEFNNVVKKYKETVLKELIFKIHEYEYVAILGNNGCGKTTTINIMCNLIPYDSGIVNMFGQKVTHNYVSYKNKLGIVLSYPCYIEDFTPYEYLKFICKFQFVPKHEIEKRIEDVVFFFKIEDIKKKKIKEYSSGNQMKISLCAALIHNPELLVLDEPFINLDIETIERITVLLKSLKGKKTLFISSHDLDLVADLCDRFLIMDEGKIVLDIKKSEYDSIQTIKENIKKVLVKENNTKSIAWLK